MELFDASDDKFLKSIISGSGDDVNVAISDVVLYSVLPFGQLFMRIYKYNGSLDKIYLMLLIHIKYSQLTNSHF